MATVKKNVDTFQDTFENFVTNQLEAAAKCIPI